MRMLYDHGNVTAGEDDTVSENLEPVLETSPEEEKKQTPSADSVSKLVGSKRQRDREVAVSKK